MCNTSSKLLKNTNGVVVGVGVLKNILAGPAAAGSAACFLSYKVVVCIYNGK